MPATETILRTPLAKERELWFVQRYEEAYPKVAKFVANRGGTFQDAKDIFQDALVILYEKMSHKNSIELSADFYLIGIAKHLWIRKYKDDRLKVSLSSAEQAISIPEDYFEISMDRLSRLLMRTGKKCMELLQAFYYDNTPLEQIRSAFGFSTIHSAAVQKFKCIEKLRAFIQKKSMDYDDFA